MGPLHCLLLALLIAGTHGQCPGSYTLVGGRCLWFINDLSLEFSDARDTCDFYDGALAKIDDCNLLGEVAKYITDNGLDISYWIGASDLAQEGTFLWHDTSPVQMRAPFWGGTNFGSLEPQDDGDNCVAMAPQDGFYFHNENCAEEFSAICQLNVPDNSPCSAPFMAIAGGCYEFLDSVSITWEDARDSCQAIGGDLAIINDCNDMAAIISYIEGSGMSSYFWIGGVKVAVTWMWIDGSEMAMGSPFWGRNQTDGLEPDGGTEENYVMLYVYDRYHFNDVPASYTYSPLCEASLGASDN